MGVSTFDALCRNYLVESVVDMPRDQLCPDVWDDPTSDTPHIKYKFREQILKGIEILKDYGDVRRFYLIGSILTKQWNDASDVDVTVEMSESMPEAQKKIVINVIVALNDLLKPIAGHRTNFYAIFGVYDIDNTEAAYDFINAVWIKKPHDSNANIPNKILKKFENRIREVDLTAANLNRNLIDWNELKEIGCCSYGDVHGLALKKYSQIVRDIETLVDAYEEIAEDRRKLFKQDLSPAQIKEYGSRMRMPANILYKLLERYHYAEMIKTLKKIMDGGITPSEITSLAKESLDHNVNHRHRRAGGGLNTNRKHQNLVPDYVKVDPSRNKSVDDIRNGKIGFKTVGKIEAQTICAQYNCFMPDPGKSVGLGKTGIWMTNNGSSFTLKQQ